MATILCVDDEAAFLALLEHHLASAGHDVILVEDPTQVLPTLEGRAVDLILADSQMPQMTGLELMSELEERGRRIPFVIITGHATIEHAVMAMRQGAVDYLTKPVRPETLAVTVQHALDFARLRQENEVFRQELSRITARRRFVGRSKAIRELQDTIGMVAPTRASVLLEGESGTGKELLARAIHEQSPRRDKPFITVNCAALPDGLVESVLFGHEKGAFTGATARALGAFERANGGTLLLDEISEMRLDLQAKLLRAIQEQEFERVGGREPIKVDVRLVATTNRNLREEAEAGRFRLDLYYRLQVVPIRTPPLRERPEDIPVMMQQFLKSAEDNLGVKVGDVPAETIERLQAYHWPGNVRELGNAVERAVILARGRALTFDYFEPYLHQPASTPGPGTRSRTAAGPAADSAAAPPPEMEELPINLEELERLTIQRALDRTGGNRTQAARLLGISERTLRNKLNG